MKDRRYSINNRYFHSSTKKVNTNDGKTIKVTKNYEDYSTPSGTFRKEVWIELVKEQVKANNEEDIYNRLVEYTRALPWLKKEKDIEQYALSLYSSRIFENDKWVSYREFNNLPAYETEKVKLNGQEVDQLRF